MENTHDANYSLPTKSLKGFLTQALEEVFYLKEKTPFIPEPQDYEESHDHSQFLQQYLKPFT